MATKKPKQKKSDPEVISVSERKARIVGGEVGRKQKEIYLKWKAFALERERKNFSKLFIIHEKKNWWKMIGNSAIVYHYQVSKWIGLSSKLVPDTDYNCKSEDGVVNIKDIYLLDQKLAAGKINLLDSTKEYRIYNIGKKFTVADIEAMKKTHELEWARVNKIILPKEVFPSLFVCLRELIHIIYFSTKAIEGYSREVIGSPMLEKIADLIREYSLLSNRSGFTETDYLERVEITMCWISAQMTVISELRLMDLEKVYRILRTVEKTKRCLRQCHPKKI